MNKHKELLQDAKGKTEEIITATEDPVVKAELADQLANCENNLQSLDDKLKDRKSKLDSIIGEVGAFQNDCDDFLRWLTTTERTLAVAKPVSGDADTVKQQLEDFKVSA